MKVVCDLETDKLVNPEKIHCAVCIDVETRRVYRFRNILDDPVWFTDFARGVTHWIGHHFIGFDGPVLNTLLGLGIKLELDVTDTLVIARTLNYNQKGGNSLEAWSERRGTPKSTFSDFSKWSQPLEDRCVGDAETTLWLWDKFKGYLTGSWADALRLEHRIAALCNELHTNGFQYDISNSITTSIPPRYKSLGVVIPKRTLKGTISLTNLRWFKDKDGTVDLSAFTEGAEFDRIAWIPFNPASPKQCVERLWEYGWEPYEKTKGHLKAERDRDKDKLEHFGVYGWKISDQNLGTLPEDAPEGPRMLKEWLLLNSRAKALETWEAAYRPPNGLTGPIPGGRIHGQFNHIGAWTHRMSHSEPNMANIPSHIGRDGEIAPYGKEFRQLWLAAPGHVLVGTDAEGIQLRVLAHYMKDEKFTKAVAEGNSDFGTDVHTLNKHAIGPICRDRQVAKTFIYSWILGAGEGKTASVLRSTKGEAREARDRFVSFYPGLKTLKKEIIPLDARRGYFVGLDNRFVLCSSEHFMLAGYLQAGEAVVMKRAAVHWRDQLIKAKLPFKLVDFVHDEWQTEVPESENNDLAKEVGRIQADSIRIVGEELNLKCPMKGKFKIGMNWYDTH